MGDQPTPDDILSAMRSSGYLMEQEVASTLEALHFHVQTNRAFEDSDEGKSRELDVAAITRVYHDETTHLSVFVELLCECKNNRSPFVFLLRPKTPADDHREVEELIFPRAHYDVPVESTPNTTMRQQAVDFLGIRPLHYRSATALKAVQFAKVVRDGKTWTANHSGLYDAVFYPLVKAMLAKRQELRERKDPWRYVWLLFPMVVTSGELFTMDTAGQPPVPESTDYVSYVRHIKGSKIDGYFAVDFVTQQGLRRHVEERIMPFATAVVERAKAATTSFDKER